MLDTTVSSISYLGSGGQTVFPIPFPFLETSHIHAHVRDDSGACRTLAAGLDFCVNHISDGNGELILLADPLSDAQTLVIRRLVPLTQEIFFHNLGPYSPAALETVADKLTMIVQQLQDGLEELGGVPPEGACRDREAAAHPVTGDIRPFPFRAGELPEGWYACNGDRYLLATRQGKALLGLSANLKRDWGVAVVGTTVSLPNLLSGAGDYFAMLVGAGFTPAIYLGV